MEKWLCGLEERLPQWLAKSQTQWAQWVYAIWQLLRCNPVILLLLSYLPFLLRQYLRKKAAAVVVLGDSREYHMKPEEMEAYFGGGPVRLKNLEEITKHKPNDNSFTPAWYTVKHHNYYYITHIFALCDLTKCRQLFGEDIIFVERLLKISGSLAVGKQLSETEAYEKIFTKRYYCSKGASLVVPTNFNYVDFSSKFWVVMSTLPILLQANSYEKLSNLLSFFLILLDLNRGRFYRLYDRAFNGFTKFVKLKGFKLKTDWYDFMSIFSNRWGYTDTVKKHAYVAKDRLKVCWYSKLEKPGDIKIVGWERYREDPNDQNIFMEIDIDQAHCELMKYNDVYAVVELQRPVHVF